MTQHDTRAGAQARSATRVSQRRTWAAPDVALRQHPNAVSGPPRPVSSASPVPYRACNAPALFRGLPRNPETKNRLGLQLFCDCGLSRGAKTRIAAPKRSKNGRFRAWRSREESVIAKKLQRYRVFCFCNGLNRRNGADPAKNAWDIMASNPKSETKRRPLCGRL